MRALIVSPFFPPQNAVASLRVHSFAHALMQAGAAVTILTVRKRPDQQGLELPCDGFDIAEISYRVPRLIERLRGHHKSAVNGEGSPRRGGAFRRMRDRRGVYSSVRMPDLTDFWIRPALRWCRRFGTEEPWDVVISSSGPYTAHLVARSVRRRRLARCWVADFRDLWSKNHAYPGIFPLTLRERWLEQRCLEQADLITTVSTGLRRSLEARCRTPVIVIYNGYDEDAVELLPREGAFPDDGLVRIVYTGALYPPEQDPSPLLMAMAALRRDRAGVFARLRLAVAGHGSGIWTELARARQLEAAIENRGTVGRQEALHMQRDADALLLVDWPRPAEGVLTGKLFEYLVAGGPILAVGGVAGTPIEQAIRRSRRGLHLGRDVARIGAFLVDLVERPETLRQEPDAAFVATLSRRRQADRFVERVQAIVQR